jgi:hypothetical protein
MAAPFRVTSKVSDVKNPEKNSVIVDNFYIFRAISGPPKADSPLIIDPDAVLASSVLLQRLQLVLRRYFQVSQHGRPVKHGELAHGHWFDIDPSFHAPALKQIPGVSAMKAKDHEK